MMKKRIGLLLASLLCTSCTFTFAISSSSSGGESNTQIPSSVESPSSHQTSSDDTSSPFHSSSAASSASQSSASGSDERNPATIEFYAINDFHGAVLPSGGRVGIESLSGYLKFVSGDSTVLINSGDMYQGDIESSYNKGEMLSLAMEEIGFDAFTLGNHEFDWGDAPIKANAALAEHVPFLGANIYHYDMSAKKRLGFASDLCQEYSIVERCGWKIGIIGTIGYDQITSITSTFSDAYSFLDPVSIIKNLSDTLRTDEGCDAVVLSHHGEQNELLGTGVTNVSPYSGKRYVDAVFCAHSHMNESATENGVAFVQTEGYGQSVARIRLDIDSSGATLKDYTTALNASGHTDDAIAALVSEYKSVSDLAGSPVLANADRTMFSRYEHASNLAARGMYEAAIDAGHVVDLSLTNYARANLYASNYQITYAELFNALPFDNEIMIATCSGTDIIEELSYGSMYAYNPNGITFQSNQYYTIAVTDYVVLHRNAARNYDYMPSHQINAVLEDNYRETAAALLEEIGTMNAADFSSSLSCYSKQWY